MTEGSGAAGSATTTRAPGSARLWAALRFLLVVTALANLAGLAKCILYRKELLAGLPRLTPALLTALTFLPALALVAAALLWFRRRVGLWLIVALGVVSIAADLWLGMPVAHQLTVVGLTAAVLLVTWPVRHDLR